MNARFSQLRRVAVAFYDDLRDRSAVSKQSVTVAQLWPVFVVTVSAIATSLEPARRALAAVVPLPDSAWALLACIVVAFWSVATISAKSAGQDAVIIVPATEPVRIMQYDHVPAIRTSAKVILLILLILTPFRVYRVFQDLTGLPNTLYGFVTDSRTGVPIAGARVRVISAAGVDVTSGEWQTDSRGFFLVKVAVPVGRSAYLKVLSDDCSDEALLPLSSDHERSEPRTAVAAPSLRPLFYFTLSCKERR